jgi:hypothetical protein
VTDKELADIETTSVVCEDRAYDSGSDVFALVDNIELLSKKVRQLRDALLLVQWGSCDNCRNFRHCPHCGGVDLEKAGERGGHEFGCPVRLALSGGRT